jgi:hypothetical protein
MKKIIFFISLLVLISSCYVKFPDSNQNSNTSFNTNFVTYQKEFRKVINGTRSNIKNYQTYIITDEEKFKEILKLHDSNIVSDIYIPKIDFNLKTLIAIFLGDRPSSGYFVDIEKIIEEENEIKVYIKEITPEKGDIVKAEITQPFLIIETNKSNKKIIFVNDNIKKLENKELSYTVLDIGNETGIKTFSRKILRNEQEFYDFFVEHLSGKKNTSDNNIPKIDFEKYMVVGIFFGKRDNNGYSIIVDKVIKTNYQIIIKASEIFTKNSNYQENESYPYILLQIEKNNLPVNFEINFIFSETKNFEIPNVTKILNSTLFLTGDDSYYSEPDFVLIKDSSSFQKVWNKHIGDKFESVPVIDFLRNDVIAIFIGKREKSGYAIKINKIIEDENSLKVFVEIVFNEYISKSISTSPYSMFLIPKTNKNISFILKET